MRFYRNQAVEQLAEARLAELEGALGRPLEPPIPIDLLAEQVLGLDFLWEEVEELPGLDAFGPVERRRSGAGEVNVLRMLLRDREVLEPVCCRVLSKLAR